MSTLAILFRFLLLAEPGEAVAPFALPDPLHQKIVKLEDFPQSDLVVVIFMGVDCPVTRRYVPRLAELVSNYGPLGVHFVGVSSSIQDSTAKIVNFSQSFRVPFPIVRDAGGIVASSLGAKRTPEAFIIDRQRKLRYKGRIDDQFTLEYDRATPTRLDLVVALEEILSDKEVREPITSAVGCLIGQQRPITGEGRVTWHKDIASIVRRHCHQCHRSKGSAPFPLIRFSDTEGWGAQILEAIDQKRMPPWFADQRHGSFSNANILTKEDRALIKTWVDDGCPEGEMLGESELAADSVGWRLSVDPDLVFPMNANGFEVAAEGRPDYRYYVIDPGFTERTLVSGAEIRPGNRAVVWQANVSILPPGLASSIGSPATFEDLHANLLCWYSPDGAPFESDSDYAKEIPAGAKLVFQILYRPTGRAEVDRTSLGLLLANPAEVGHIVRTIGVFDTEFALEPGVSDQRVTHVFTVPEEWSLLSVTPRLNVRGRAFRMTTLAPSNGQPTVLLDIPRYNFYWQPSFREASPTALDSSSQLEISAVYDNSEGNPLNPDPTANVRVGNRLSDELLVAYLEVVSRLEDREPSTPASILDDPTRNVSFALGGLGLTVLLCLVLLWLKPVPTPTVTK